MNTGAPYSNKPEMPDRDILAAMTIHELREPIHAVQNFLAILLQQRAGPLNDIQVDFLSTAQQAIHRMARRIDDVRLAFDEHAALTVERCPVELRAHLEQCCRELMPLARIYGVEFVIEEGANTARSAAGTLQADPERLDQILLNLLENALQHAAAGSKITVTLSESASAYSIVIRNKIDGNVTVEPEHWFAPYWRTQRPNGRASGMGLGLIIAEHLARAHGGSIMAYAEDAHVAVEISFPRQEGLVETHHDESKLRVAAPAAHGG